MESVQPWLLNSLCKYRERHEASLSESMQGKRVQLMRFVFSHEAPFYAEVVDQLHTVTVRISSSVATSFLADSPGLTRITESTGDIVHLNEFRPTLFRDEANHLFLGLEILRFTRITGSLGDKYGDEARPLGKDRDVADWVEVLKAAHPKADLDGLRVPPALTRQNSGTPLHSTRSLPHPIQLHRPPPTPSSSLSRSKSTDDPVSSATASSRARPRLPSTPKPVRLWTESPEPEELLLRRNWEESVETTMAQNLTRLVPLAHDDAGWRQYRRDLGLQEEEGDVAVLAADVSVDGAGSDSDLDDLVIQRPSIRQKQLSPLPATVPLSSLPSSSGSSPPLSPSSAPSPKTLVYSGTPKPPLAPPSSSGSVTETQSSPREPRSARHQRMGLKATLSMTSTGSRILAEDSDDASREGSKRRSTGTPSPSPRRAESAEKIGETSRDTVEEYDEREEEGQGESIEVPSTVDPYPTPAQRPGKGPASSAQSAIEPSASVPRPTILALSKFPAFDPTALASAAAPSRPALPSSRISTDTVKSSQLPSPSSSNLNPSNSSSKPLNLMRRTGRAASSRSDDEDSDDFGFSDSSSDSDGVVDAEDEDGARLRPGHGGGGAPRLNGLAEVDEEEQDATQEKTQEEKDEQEVQVALGLTSAPKTSSASLVQDRDLNEVARKEMSSDSPSAQPEVRAFPHRAQALADLASDSNLSLGASGPPFLPSTPSKPTPAPARPRASPTSSPPAKRARLSSSGSRSPARSPHPPSGLSHSHSAASPPPPPAPSSVSASPSLVAAVASVPQAPHSILPAASPSNSFSSASSKKKRKKDRRSSGFQLDWIQPVPVQVALRTDMLPPPLPPGVHGLGRSPSVSTGVGRRRRLSEDSAKSSDDAAREGRRGSSTSIAPPEPRLLTPITVEQVHHPSPASPSRQIALSVPSIARSPPPALPSPSPPPPISVHTIPVVTSLSLQRFLSPDVPAPSAHSPPSPVHHLPAKRRVDTARPDSFSPPARSRPYFALDFTLPAHRLGRALTSDELRRMREEIERTAKI